MTYRNQFKSQNNFRRVSLALVALTLVAPLFTVASARAGEAVELLSTPATLPAKHAVQTDATVTRRRPVKLNAHALEALDRGQTLRLNLFANASFDAVIEDVQLRSDGSYSLLGRLAGKQHSSFAISVQDDVLVGNIRTMKDGVYQIRFLGDGLHEARQIDDAKFAPCGVGEEDQMHAPGADAVVAGNAVVTATDNNTVIDVMVVYTPAARDAVGGVPAMRALIDLAVDESNQAYAHSQIIPRLRLVYKGEISYSESGSFYTDLDRLRSSSDGYMDEVHSLRNTYGADMVSLFVNDRSLCGLAYAMSSLSSSTFAPNAFSVVNHGCATGDYSFSHELGHNMGCKHDRANSTSEGLYSYSYGWRFTGNSGQQWHDIMAYDPGTRIQYFSNPNVTFDGVPTGVPAGQVNESDTAQTINNSASIVANWRQATLSPVPTAPTGLSPGIVLDNGSVVVRASPVNLHWNPPASANRYEVDVWHLDVSTSRWVYDTAIAVNGTYTYYTLPVRNTHYAWTVRAGNASGWGEWSPIVFFSFEPLTCTFAISPQQASFAAAGGVGRVTVTASSSLCKRTASSPVSWITITGGSMGAGNGTVTYSVAANTTKLNRSATLTIAGKSFYVSQGSR